MIGKHTPGPWKAEIDVSVKTVEAQGKTVAIVWDEDDATLIAAAPEMYEALVDLLDICECDNTDAECINRFGAAMEAIKKAEGES